MPVFQTTYFVNGRPYGSAIDAFDVAEARLIAMQRNIGERVISDGGARVRDDPAFGPSVEDIVLTRAIADEFLSPGDIAAAIHGACWLGYLALSSGRASVAEILGDEGLIHRLAHLAAHDPCNPSQERSKIAILAMDIAARIPGLPALPLSCASAAAETEKTLRPTTIFTQRNNA